MLISFVFPGIEDAAALERLDPDRDWRQFMKGERAWVLQTWLRLRTAGCPVQLLTALPREGIAVFSAKHRWQLRATAPRGTRALLVAIRQDVGRTRYADCEVVQNGVYADGRERHFVPMWPQPGLVARDPARGTRVERLAFKGLEGNLHPQLRGSAWREFISREGLAWDLDAVAELASSSAQGVDWNDYRNTDLVVALRADDPQLHPRKPASKLYNAWHAGVPAILGPERAFRELRRDPLDYLEAGNLAEVIEAVRRLRADPGLYARMVAHGNVRAAQFSVASITECWKALLYETLPPLAQRAAGQRWRAQPLWLKDFTRRVLG